MGWELRDAPATCACALLALTRAALPPPSQDASLRIGVKFKPEQCDVKSKVRMGVNSAIGTPSVRVCNPGHPRLGGLLRWARVQLRRSRCVVQESTHDTPAHALRGAGVQIAHPPLLPHVPMPVPSQKGDKLSMHYTGTLYKDGSKFDSSLDRSSPFEFTLGQGMVIKGWDEGLVGMCPGEKRKLIIPSGKGYGDSGSPPKIPVRLTARFGFSAAPSQALPRGAFHLLASLPPSSPLIPPQPTREELRLSSRWSCWRSSSRKRRSVVSIKPPPVLAPSYA